MRTAISLANRLQDSMHELLSLDPKALGLGHALDEVHQGLLNRVLDRTISSCVAKVGIDVNRAGVGHLARVPGMTREMAKKIFDKRKKDGSFQSLAALRENDLLTEDEFRQVAGFLRIWGGSEPLDGTGIHPEDYELVAKVAEREGCAADELHKKRVQIPPAELADEGRGPLRVRDVLAELQHYGEDIRGKLVAVKNEGVHSIDDLRPDAQLRGRVTNLTEFGAFVDLGIQQDGLVHISQIPPGRLKNAQNMLAVGEVITVYVIRVEKEKKRISLSMHKPRHVAEGRQPTIGERMQQGGNRGGGRGRGRGREQRAPEPLTRAARAPEGRRAGGRRGAPRPAGAGSGGGPGGGGGFGGGGGGGRGRGRGRDDRGGRGGPPRVITVESERPIEDVRGHKGELTSLSSLANLLGGGKSEKAETPPPAPPPEPQAEEPKDQSQGESPSSDA